MRDGFNVIMRNKGVSWVMVTEVLVTFFVMPMVALMPLMTLKNFSGTAYQVSLIEALFGAGMLAGGALLGVWNPKIRKILLIATSYFYSVWRWHSVECFRLKALSILPY